MEEEERKTKVKQALCRFLRSNSLEDGIEAVDDVVLDYVISILEDLGEEENGEDNIDIDQFTEMLEAYIPGFASIDSIKICEWMFELSTSLVPNTTKGSPIPDDRAQMVMRQLSSPCVQVEPKSPLLNHSSSDDERKEKKGAEARSTCSSKNEADMEFLLEMFPSACQMEVTHCLGLAGWDTEKAAQLIIHREEVGDSIRSSSQGKETGTKKQLRMLEDEDLKKKMLSKYSFIDSEEDKRKHKPVTPKAEPKKMIRYLNGRVVNTRGDKFTDTKKEESEDMKKTYINLTPARKYRFH